MPDHGHYIVVVGASAGGVEALIHLVSALPRDLPAAVFVVLHLAPQPPDLLPRILGRKSLMPVKAAEDGEAIRHGMIYVPRPDLHLSVERGHVRLTHGPRENAVRPAVDVLFRSAAYAYGPRVVGVVLSGNLDDGTAGLQAIKRRGGIAVVQDPRDALFPGMPTSAVENVAVDHIVPVSEMAGLLTQLAQTPAPSAEAFPVPEGMAVEANISEEGVVSMEEMTQLGKPSTFTCPECGGTLWEVENGGVLRFRCHVGHAYSTETLEAQQQETLEGALWAAVRSLDESSSLSRQVAARARQHKNELIARSFEERAAEAEQNSRRLRELLVSKQSPT